MTPKEKAFLKLVGTNIKQTRINKEITQRELAARLEMEPSNLVPIEAGNQNATILMLYRISRALKCEVKDFLVAENQ